MNRLVDSSFDQPSSEVGLESRKEKREIFETISIDSISENKTFRELCVGFVRLVGLRESQMFVHQCS